MPILGLHQKRERDGPLDRIGPHERSAIMAKVASKNTRPELLVRSMLFRAGLRFRLHARELPGSPDVVLPKHRTIVFVHGCFWHGHDCRSGRNRPKSNAGYWEAKLDRNISRDRDARLRLEEQGWTVHVIWTCQLEHDTQRLIEALHPGSARA
ncbi:very short patch repair endonuclease [Mesorhizobium sp. B263B2A]|uniref:very short patch repair endonuclease n=1 Tax=Mesorhizobium sp. B263B2A TaxID=2876669 RepID=UPI001CD0E672|nr:very short patch repair endonuclease [Mesorhizobium sp. B263B2A]MCA0029250.1 very short patch repair endonuclease [Mesorhizobium sp. B263B2A]